MASEGDPRDLRERTKHLALEIVRVYGDLPKTTEALVRGRQLLRCGTSVGPTAARARVRARPPRPSASSSGDCRSLIRQRTGLSWCSRRLSAETLACVICGARGTH